MIYDTKKCWDRTTSCRERVSEKHPQTSLQCLWKCYGRQKHHWSLGEVLPASETGREKLSVLSSSGRPVATISLEMLQRADAIVRGDRRITTRQLASSLSISKESVRHFVRDLGYSKASARWVARSLTVATQNRE